MKIQSIITLLYVLMTSSAVIGQSSVTNTIFASTNLAAPPHSETVINSKAPISGTSSIDCMKAYAYSAPDGTIKVYSQSSNCGLVNKPHASGYWLANFQVIGNNQQAIPLSFNFSISSNTYLQSYLVQGCLSIASAQFFGKVFSEKAEQRFNSTIAYQQSQLRIYSVSGFSKSEATAKIGLGISLGTNQVEIKEIPDEWKAVFLQRYKNLPSKDQILDPQIVEALLSGISLLDFEVFSNKLNEGAGTLLNLLKSLGILKDLEIELPGGVKVGVAFNIGFDYNMKRSVEITTQGNGFVGGEIQTITATSTCGETVANLDASNTFKLVSVTVPNNFNNAAIKLENLFVEWDGVKIPVTKSLVVSVEDVKNRNLNLSVNPNPAGQSFSVLFGEPEKIDKIEIYAVSGKLVYQKMGLGVIREFTIRDFDFPVGTYVLKVQSEGRVSTHKLMHIL